MDGTLTAPRKVVTPEMRQFLADLRKKVTVGVVGGSDLAKAKEQLGEDYLDIVDWYVTHMSLPERRHALRLCASVHRIQLSAGRFQRTGSTRSGMVRASPSRVLRQECKCVTLLRFFGDLQSSLGSPSILTPTSLCCRTSWEKRGSKSF